MLPYWCWSSLIRTQDEPPLSERKTPFTPSMVATVNTAGYVEPGAAAPNPTLIASPVTLATLVKLAPELVEWNIPVLPVSQMSPSCPRTALNLPPLGRPDAAVCVKVCP